VTGDVSHTEFLRLAQVDAMASEHCGDLLRDLGLPHRTSKLLWRHRAGVISLQGFVEAVQQLRAGHST